MTINRRNFICDSALTTSGLANRKHAMSSCAPGDKNFVALTGCKGMGINDLTAFLKQPEVVCAGSATGKYRKRAGSACGEFSGLHQIKGQTQLR